MRRMGMDSATFSIEYFYDPRTRQISLLNGVAQSFPPGHRIKAFNR